MATDPTAFTWAAMVVSKAMMEVAKVTRLNLTVTMAGPMGKMQWMAMPIGSLAGAWLVM